jgi:UTP:GlnB (protein PII) uridylyltransferase
VSALRGLLEPTSLPDELVDEVLAETNTLWLLGATDELVASELVLCHPALGSGEVRAVVTEAEEPGLWRVTVVTHDRPGLLAATCATLSAAGLSIVDAAGTVLPRSRLAMQRLTVSSPEPRVTQAAWGRLGRDLRATLAGGELPPSRFVPSGPVVVEAQPQELGRSVVTVEAPDGLGLLHAAAAWFEANGCNVEACRAGTEGAQARGVFIVLGPVDTAALARLLGGSEAGSVVTRVATTPFHLAGALFHPAAALAGAAGGAVTALLRSVRSAARAR